MQQSISNRKSENVLGLGLLQPNDQMYRQNLNLNEPVFTENNSLIEDLS